MISNKPYLLRAFHDWIVDSLCTPILIVNANYPGCKVPEQHIDQDGEILFNISSIAVRSLVMNNELVEFSASFSGAVNFVSVPVQSVRAIYAHENGDGMYFNEEAEGDTVVAGHNLIHHSEPTQTAISPSQEKKKSHLVLVE